MPGDIWSLYQSRLDAHGITMREASKKKEIRMLASKLSRSLSYHAAIVDGLDQRVAIINSDNLNEKKIYSMPGETIACGAIVEWEGSFWIVTEKDAADELYTKCKMKQCNHLLKWVDEDSIIHEQWCVIDDGTKYMTGDYEDRDFIVTRGDARISMLISKNEHTVKFGRHSRFIIDDPDSTEKLSYSLSKPLRVGWHYNGEGVYQFVLKESNSTDDDNIELGIADYYKYFPKDGDQDDIDIPNSEIQDDNQNGKKKVWL